MDHALTLTLFSLRSRRSPDALRTSCRHRRLGGSCLGGNFLGAISKFQLFIGVLSSVRHRKVNSGWKLLKSALVTATGVQGFLGRCKSRVLVAGGRVFRLCGDPVEPTSHTVESPKRKLCISRILHHFPFTNFYQRFQAVSKVFSQRLSIPKSRQFVPQRSQVNPFWDFFTVFCL